MTGNEYVNEKDLDKFFNKPANKYVATLYNSMGMKIDETIISVPKESLNEILMDLYTSKFSKIFKPLKIILKRKGNIRAPFGLFKLTIPKQYYSLKVNDNKYIVHVLDLGIDRL